MRRHPSFTYSPAAKKQEDDLLLLQFGLATSATTPLWRNEGPKRGVLPAVGSLALLAESDRVRRGVLGRHDPSKQSGFTLS